MPSHTRRPFLRAVATCLLLLQVNLLWIAALHHHEQWAHRPGQAQKIRQGDRHTLPADDTALFCPVCQIVRQSAARPSTSSPAPELLASVAGLPAVAEGTFRSYAPLAIYGRAPPLA